MTGAAPTLVTDWPLLVAGWVIMSIAGAVVLYIAIRRAIEGWQRAWRRAARVINTPPSEPLWDECSSPPCSYEDNWMCGWHQLEAEALAREIQLYILHAAEERMFDLDSDEPRPGDA